MYKYIYIHTNYYFFMWSFPHLKTVTQLSKAGPSMALLLVEVFIVFDNSIDMASACHWVMYLPNFH